MKGSHGRDDDEMMFEIFIAREEKDGDDEEDDDQSKENEGRTELDHFKKRQNEALHAKASSLFQSLAERSSCCCLCWQPDIISHPLPSCNPLLLREI